MSPAKIQNVTAPKWDGLLKREISGSHHLMDVALFGFKRS
jgi:hypothetical protein